MAEKYGLLIDYTWCTGCHSCEMACKVEHGWQAGEANGIQLFDSLHNRFADIFIVEVVAVSDYKDLDAVIVQFCLLVLNMFSVCFLPCSICFLISILCLTF